MSAAHSGKRKSNPTTHPEMRGLLALKQSSDEDSTPQGTDLAELEESLSLWKRFLIFLLPLTAAFAKAFTNSFSTLSIFVFFTTGVFVVNPALFTGPLFIVICAMGAATVIVSLNMEGRSLYQGLCSRINKKKKRHEEILNKEFERQCKELKDNALSIEAYYKKVEGIIQKIEEKNLKEARVNVTPWSKLEESNTAAVLLGFLFIVSSATKGLAMAPGIFNILGLASCGPWAWVILALAAIAVMSVSAAKEGKQLLKKVKFFQPKYNPNEKNEPPSFLKKFFIYFFSCLLPLVAAGAKALGYSYGLLMLLAYIYTGSFAATAAVSAWLPLIIVVGIGLALVSLRMEGHALFKGIRRLFISDQVLGVKSKYYINDQATREVLKKIENDDLGRMVIAIEKKLKQRPNRFWYWCERVAFGFFSLLAYSLPALAFIGKSSVMMVGTISAIVLLSGGMPISWWLLLIGAMAGLAVGLVSVFKEGEKTCSCVRKYYTLFIYKCFVDREASLQLVLFESPEKPMPSKGIIPKGVKPTLLKDFVNKDSENNQNRSSKLLT